MNRADAEAAFADRLKIRCYCCHAEGRISAIDGQGIATVDRTLTGEESCVDIDTLDLAELPAGEHSPA